MRLGNGPKEINLVFPGHKTGKRKLIINISLVLTECQKLLPGLCTWQAFSWFTFVTPLLGRGGGYCYYHHFTGEQTKAQKERTWIKQFIKGGARTGTHSTGLEVFWGLFPGLPGTLWGRKGTRGVHKPAWDFRVPLLRGSQRTVLPVSVSLGPGLSTDLLVSFPASEPGLFPELGKWPPFSREPQDATSSGMFT